jgi:hypothetical protein
MRKYAKFLEICDSMDMAERYYETIINTDPTFTVGFQEYAQFLYKCKKDADKADSIFQKGLLTASGKSTCYHCNFYTYSISIDKNYLEGEYILFQWCRKNPNEENNLSEEDIMLIKKYGQRPRKPALNAIRERLRPRAKPKFDSADYELKKK